MQLSLVEKPIGLIPRHPDGHRHLPQVQLPDAGG